MVVGRISWPFQIERPHINIRIIYGLVPLASVHWIIKMGKNCSLFMCHMWPVKHFIQQIKNKMTNIIKSDLVSHWCDLCDGWRGVQKREEKNNQKCFVKSWHQWITFHVSCDRSVCVAYVFLLLLFPVDEWILWSNVLSC